MLHHHAVPAAVADLLNRLAPALEGFSLAGGTSLALRFGHRLSVDLDFFTKEAFDSEPLGNLPELAKAVVLARSPGSLTVMMDGTKVDFLRHDYPLLNPPEVIDGVRMLTVPDVAAMKLNAIANRGSKKDFFDLAMLLRIHSLEEMLGFFEAKYANSDRFIVMRSLGWFDDAELEPDPLSFGGASWQEVKKIVAGSVRNAG